MLGLGESFSLGISDEAGNPIVGERGHRPGSTTGQREFPLMFFDPNLLVVDPPGDLVPRSWVLVADLTDGSVPSANRMANRASFAVAVAAIAFFVGLMLSIRAVKKHTALIRMRSDFVAAITHELKTPIAGIRVIGETLAADRHHLPERLREYARIAVSETKRLTRLVDNLLSYTRLTDVEAAYAFEPIAVRPIVDRTLDEFAWQLQKDCFDVSVDVPEELPPVFVDRTAIELVLNNLVDNAIRYSKQTRSLAVTATQNDGMVIVAIADRGIGIPEEEVMLVRRKFVRGKMNNGSGSGLGLAIAERIMADHGGSLSIRSIVGEGTTVSIALPVP
jgi:two-component system phosphate regulon sensor histidine kinase PhoR